MRRVRAPLAGWVVVALFLWVLPAASGGRPFTVTLTGPAEAPSAGDPDGAGTAMLELNSGQGKVCYTLMVGNILLPASAAHIHQAPAGVAGPVVVPLEAPDENGLASGCADTAPALIKDIEQNPSIYYVNVHNAPYPAGAVRGQLSAEILGREDDLHSQNMHFMANSTKMAVNSDLAFWGDRAFVGNYIGFRIFDISSPANPRLLADFPCNGAQGDISVWGNLLFTSIDRPQTTDACTGVNTPGFPVQVPGFEGIRIFDVSNPSAPVFIKGVATDCGSHTHTLVPDPANNRLLLYVSSYPASFLGPTPFGTNCSVPHSKISVVEVPLNNPSAASVISQPAFALTPFFANGGRGCHDITVFLPLNLAAASCLGEAQIWDISDVENPVALATFDNPNVQIWHNAAFTWDGKYVAFGDEFGGGGAFGCKSTDPTTRGAIWFYNVMTPGAPLLAGHFKIPRFQEVSQFCTAHNFNIIPRSGRYILVSAWYMGGTSVADFTNPADPFEVGYYDAQHPRRSDVWSSYWYNGFVYVNDIARGFDVYGLSDSAAAGARRLRHMNPQTQEGMLP